MEFNERIKARRLQLGLTTDDVAKVVGVSNATISRWETGTIKNQRRDKLELLAVALKVTPAEMLGWTKEPTQEDVELDNDLMELLTEFPPLTPSELTRVADFIRGLIASRENDNK